MIVNNRTRPLIVLILLVFMFSIASAQEVQVPKDRQGEIERLRGQYEEQKLEIEKLRAEIRKEGEMRLRQQALIETLIEKLDKIATPAPRTEIIPAVSQTSPGPTPTPAIDSSQKSVNLVENGFGKVKFTGFIQGWFAAADQGFGNTFRIRRAEMKFAGDLLPKVKWSVMFDLAKALSLNSSTTTVGGTPVVRTVAPNQASRIFQEAFITLGYHKRANVQIGQFKIPLSQEGLQSTSTLDTIERALFLSDRSRGGGLGDARDLGAMVFGPVNDQLDYQFGVFNGTGESQNDVDQNKQKAFVGRLVFKPDAIKGLQIGGSGAWAERTADLNPQRHRLGAELVYERDKLRVKSEFMSGIDGDIHRRGYYTHFGYRFRPKVEAIFRFDAFDPHTGLETTAATVTERDYITGINYYIKDHNFKFQFNYLRKTFANGVTPSRNLFLVNLQTAW